MAAKLEAKFDACESLWAARVLAHEVFDAYGSLRKAREILKKKISYKGEDIDVRVKLYDVSVGRWDCIEHLVEVHQYVKSYRGHQKVRPEKIDRIHAKDSVIRS